jgi:ABC-type multidrug transport system permease subunit
VSFCFGQLRRPKQNDIKGEKMKTMHYALLSLKRSFRSAFALVFMFAIPLLVTGMFSLMFGSTPAAATAAPQFMPSPWVELRAPLAAAQAPASPLALVITPIMGGMLVFFAFFTGASTCQSILREGEDGTLARLFTTPTALRSILGGKFAAVGLTVLVQVIVLLAAARLLFGIQWGALPAIACAALGIILSASAFGIFLTSLLKTSKQAGAIFGGLLTITGMTGMLSIFSSTGIASQVALVMPQGWAVRGLTLAIQAAPLGEAALNLLALVGWSILFFTLGLIRFQKRFA